MNDNILVLSDSYKVGHYNMLPDNTQVVYSYFESRKGALYPYTTFFGLQYLLKKNFLGQVVTREKIEEMAKICKYHFGDESFFNRKGWEYILNTHGGKLPIRIKAVPEGLSVPTSNVLMTVENTDENCAWLTNYIETLLTHIWYSSGVCTRSRVIKQIISEYLTLSSDNIQSLPFLVHDFGCRSVSSMESAAIGGASHLVNFLGTDTMPALSLLRDYYHGKYEELGFSVAASEHSIATAEGELGEKDYLIRLLNKYPNGILSVVSDSYNIERFVKDYVASLKDVILERCKNGKGYINRLVIRPDSPRWVGDTPANQVLWIMDELWRIFGGTLNSKGYKVLNPAVGVIYGDSLSTEEIHEIYRWATNHKYDVSSIVCGQGGGLLQKINRDTQRNAFKCSAQKRNDFWFNVYKKPLDETKSSKRGKLALIKVNNEYTTVSLDTIRENEKDILVTVFEDGELVKDYTIAEVRENSKI